MIFLYRIITLLFYPIFVIIIFYRKIVKKEDKNRFKEKIFSSSFNIKRKDNTKLIWFHGASVGEIQSIIPLIERLEKDRKINQILITSNTLSSSIIINKLNLRKTIHQDNIKVVLTDDGADEIFGGYKKVYYSYLASILIQWCLEVSSLYHKQLY